MTGQLGTLLATGQSGLILGLVVFLRVGATMALLPAFAERSVSVRIRLILTIAFTVIVAPAVAANLPDITTPTQLATYFFTETIAGLAVGAVVRFFFLALQMAGSIAAQSTSLSQIFGGATADPQPAIGHVLLVSGLALAVMADLHLRIAQMLILSYEVFPLGQLPDGQIFSGWAVTRVAHAFGMAFALAAPFVVASLIYNIALGVINRAMPQLMVAFVGAPAITAGGLALLLVSAPFLLQVWLRTLNVFLTDIGGAG